MECFTIYADEIEGRIDPLYLKNKAIIESQRTKFALVALGRLLKSKVQYGANEIAINRNSKQDIRYIRITDIDEFGNLKLDEWKTAQNIEEKYLLNEGDVLFARSGATAGKCFLYKNVYGKSIFAGYLIRFIFDISKVDPKYIFYCTQLERYKSWVKSIQRPSGQPNINSEEFKSFKIPLPSVEIQNHITEIMDNAYEIKKQKETEAQQLLNSIDDYVLSELGIILPELKDEMYYVVYADEVKNNRCDAYYYQPKFEEVEEAIKRGTYKTKKFNEIAKQLINGLDFRKFSEDGLTYIRVSNINPNSINNVKVRYIPPINISKKIHLKSGNLLITRKGTFGVAAVVEKNHEEFIISSEIFKIELEQEQVNPFFISIWMNSYAQKIIFDRIKTGGIMGHISQEALSDIIIPLPPLSIQNKIADEVKARMQKSEQLQKEAKEVLEEAKERVERIIMGEEEI